MVYERSLLPWLAMELASMRKRRTGKLASYERWDHSRWTPTVMPKPEMGHRMKAQRRVSAEHAAILVAPTAATTWTRVM